VDKPKLTNPSIRQAIGIQPSADGKSLTMMTKKSASSHKPKSALSTTKFGISASTRK